MIVTVGLWAVSIPIEYKDVTGIYISSEEATLSFEGKNDIKINHSMFGTMQIKEKEDKDG